MGPRIDRLSHILATGILAISVVVAVLYMVAHTP